MARDCSDPGRAKISAYFGTITQIESAGERLSIPMRREDTTRYECLSRPTEERDESTRAEWSNGGDSRRPRLILSTRKRWHWRPIVTQSVASKTDRKIASERRRRVSVWPTERSNWPKMMAMYFGWQRMPPAPKQSPPAAKRLGNR
jgi:hypothetical protein